MLRLSIRLFSHLSMEEDGYHRHESTVQTAHQDSSGSKLYPIEYTDEVDFRGQVAFGAGMVIGAGLCVFACAVRGVLAMPVSAASKVGRHFFVRD